MEILAPNGKPVSSQRTVALKLELIDREAGSTHADVATMKFLLDSDDPVVISKLLDEVKRATMQRLSATGFIKPRSSLSQRGGDGGANVVPT